MSETPRTQQLINIANDEGISDAAVALVLQEHSEQLEREIAEANIEIEGLEEEIVALCDRLKRVNGGELGKQLVEARAEIERKDKLIEQMREALKALRKYPNTYITTGQGAGIAEKDLAMCDAALAAERGE